ncbi:MAG: Rieske 2Fe-2S domain-containing protein [Deltaproteobacteria bacterium]|nr:Rieske 2Fe-2S domain-containing protein [Deltaproteobacteria bacterium]
MRRVLAHLERRTTDRDAGPTLLPVDAYLPDDARARREARLFRELPLAVAHVSQLPNPGDFLAHDATGVPLLIVRGEGGELAAFINVCRHRGTRVEQLPCGNKKAFVCPYHAWAYRRDGSLLSIPHEHGFEGIDRASRGLARVPCGEAGGIVFARPAPLSDGESPVLDAAAWLGPIAGELAGFGVGTGAAYAPTTKRKQLSWKLAIDIFLESYHLRPTHRDSIYPMFFDNVATVDRVGAHLRCLFPKRSIASLAAQPEDTWELRRHANVLYHLFPNTLLLVEPDHTAVLHLWPDGAAGTLLTAYTVVPEAPATDKARAYWDANNRILYDATDEDFAMGESIQRGLASGANREVVFGAFEHALAHFHRQIDEHAPA